MTVLPILRWPDPRLATACAPVERPEDVAQLAADMLETMYAAPGRGLAAPQVGVLKRLFVMDVSWRDGAPDPVVCINPVILWRSDEMAEGPEGCLSIPGPTTLVARAVSIRLAWTDLANQRHEAALKGFAAICAQHEHDHLDGIVTLDRLTAEARATAIAGISA
ncbi:MAG: peptide deformylase [Paracoccaceae bacterium]|nr:MAG: peptide deformylase [Paracoccaceae bacterium]